MRKLLAAVLFFFFLSPATVFAQEKFTTHSSIYYEVSLSGDTQITHYITLENAFTDYYATSYALSLFGIKPTNVSVFEGNTPLEFENSVEGDGSNLIKVLFPNAVVGKGAKREFNIRYSDSSIAQKSGSVWEVSIPRLSDPASFADYNVTLNVPVQFGELAYISPEPFEQKATKTTNSYIFKKDNLTKSTVTAAFGNFQVFNFDLVYHLENPLSRRASVDIALPPDTAFQKVYIEKLDPKPGQVYIDDDGNWLATYILNSRERFDVVAQGAVEIHAEPLPFTFDFSKSLAWNKDATEVWQSTDPQIQKLATELKTPKAIYDYVVRTLSYDYERAKPNVTRLGAVEALKNPKSAICMEFTDLFVAIARAAGIPAREVNGYAYTENPEIQPISLVADVLHSWAEYWDSEAKIWIPIDPTWGSTTGGVDFFNKLDLRHFTFVNHGKSSYQPYPAGSYKLGPNPQKDVNVSFGSLPEKKDTTPSLTVVDKEQSILKEMTVTVRVKNTGNSATHPYDLDIYFDNVRQQSTKIGNLPPLGYLDVKVAVPFSVFGSTMPQSLSFVTLGSTLRVDTNRSQVILVNILSLIMMLLVLIFIGISRIRHARLRNQQKQEPKPAI